MTKKQRFLCSITLILTLTVPALAYEFVDLGTVPGSTWTYANAINNNGQVVGEFTQSYYAAGGVLFSGSGTGNIDLGGESALGINNNGVIVGNSSAGATIFDPTGNGNNQYLGTLPGYDMSFGESINDSAQVAGSVYYSHWSAPQSQAAIFNPNGSSGYTITGLGTLTGHSYSEAYSINNSGQVVGKSMPDWGQHRATLFDITGAGGNIDLGTLDGNYSQAECINDSGKIVGSAENASGQRCAALFDETGNGNNIYLGSLNDNPGGGAYGINNLGQIVGQASDGSGNWLATLFDITGAGNNIDLNTLVDLPVGWTLRQASAINDNGWIVGFAQDSSGDRHAYLLTPEPATLGLLALGGFLIRRKK